MRFRKLDGKKWVEVEGVVAGVVRAWEDPNDHPCLNYRLADDFGKPRREKSYLILVGDKVYWPKAKNIIWGKE
mgnify:CR=1 FL=1